MKVYPSILSADFFDLSNEFSRIKSASGVHYDVMDGHFVPNISFGFPVIKSVLNHVKDKEVDIHLMVEHPLKWLDIISKFYPDIVSIHIESSDDITETLEKYSHISQKVFIAINPKTPLSLILPYIDQVDGVLFMTVQPGFGGQKFNYDVLEKIKYFREYLEAHNISKLIEVDGGVNESNALLLKGVDCVVMGSSLFSSDDPGIVISTVESL